MVYCILLSCMKKTAFISLFSQTLIKRVPIEGKCYLLPVEATSFKGSQNYNRAAETFLCQ